jgi:hypothetical protein
MDTLSLLGQYKMSIQTRSLMGRTIGRNKQQDSPAGAFLNRARQYHAAATKLVPLRESMEWPLYFLYAHTTAVGAVSSAVAVVWHGTTPMNYMNETTVWNA